MERVLSQPDATSQVLLERLLDLVHTMLNKLPTTTIRNTEFRKALNKAPELVRSIELYLAPDAAVRLLPPDRSRRLPSLISFATL